MIRSRTRALMRAENKRWPEHLVDVPRSQWPPAMPTLRRVLRSRTYLVQVHLELSGVVRLTICRTMLGRKGWEDNIPWKDLQRLKREAGYGDHCAVELYPPDEHEVNVANMRHLWVLEEAPDFMWMPIKDQGDVK